MLADITGVKAHVGLLYDYQISTKEMIMNYIKETLMVLIITLLGVFNMTEARTIYDFNAQRIDGSSASLDEYRGKAILVVNTASKCGFTKQYDGLQKLYLDYKDLGLVILGFPANNFMNQEPGDNSDIADFCRINFGVSFPLFAKISVRGKDIHPLFDWLTSKDENPDFAGKVSWNFNKFLISKEGKLIARFGSRTTPDDPALISAIQNALK